MNKIKKIAYLVCLIMLGLLVWSVPRLVRIKRIDCQSQYGYCSNEIREKLLSFQNQKNYLQTKEVISNYLGSNNLVEQYSLRFRVPAGLIVSLVEKKPLYALKASDNQYYLVDKKGSILRSVPATDLPYIEIGGEINNLDNKIGTDQLFALSILDYLGSLYGVKSGRLFNSGLEFTLADGSKVIFPKQGEAEVLIGALRLIKSSLEKTTNQITIDLRYKNPVIR